MSRDARSPSRPAGHAFTILEVMVAAAVLALGIAGVVTVSQRGLQAAWQAHGADAFSFEALEALEPKKEESAYLRDRRLKDRLDHWREALAAEPI